MIVLKKASNSFASLTISMLNFLFQFNIGLYTTLWSSLFCDYFFIFHSTFKHIKYSTQFLAVL